MAAAPVSVMGSETPTAKVDVTDLSSCNGSVFSGSLVSITAAGYKQQTHLFILRPAAEENRSAIWMWFSSANITDSG